MACVPNGDQHPHREKHPAYDGHEVSPFLSGGCAVCDGVAVGGVTGPYGLGTPTCSDITENLENQTVCQSCFRIAVTKLIDQKDWDQKCYDAIREEGNKLQKRKTWLEDWICVMVGYWHGESHIRFQDWTCAVVGYWHAGANNWKVGFVQWLAIDMNEAMTRTQDMNIKHI